MPHLLRAGRNAAQLPLFLELNIIAIGWDALGDCSEVDSLDEVKSRMREAYPDKRPAQIPGAAGQVYRFIGLADEEMVCVYDPEAREYHIGEVQSPYRFEAEAVQYRHRHDVLWRATVSRDRLSRRTRNALGSISTLSSIREDAWAEVTAVMRGEMPTEIPEESVIASASLTTEEETAEEIREEVIDRATEFIKDRLIALDWQEMEELVAGVLRGMGYKTMLTENGSDGGRDIVASPDGLGLESPRIIVEVKHRRNERMGTPQIRNFIGGLRPGDKGLYVSTGGFSGDARREADRANTPITLVDLDRLAALLTQYYESCDADTRALVPLRKVWWPV